MWWSDTAHTEHFLDDFILDALRRRGLTDIPLHTYPSSRDLLAAPRDFGFSSLDMLTLAARFSHSLGIDRTGLADLLLARRSFNGWLEVARRSLRTDDSQLAFYSSGTTGSPLPCEHTLTHLLREVHAFRALLPVAGRVVCTVPSHHIYGFIWSILLPHELGVSCHRINAALSLPGTWAATLRNDDLVIATPDIWALLVSTRTPMPSRFTAISSTSALHPDTAGAFRELYPDAVLTEVYGSSETAGIAWRHHHGRHETGDFCLLPYWQIKKHQGQWSLSDTQTEKIYPLHDRLALQQAGPGETGLPEISTGTSPVRFLVLGRADEVIQIGGHNIDLSELQKRLSTHPDIADASVRSMQTENGHKLLYYLALRQMPTGIDSWCASFEQWLNRELGDLPPPASVVLARQIPRSTLNKPLAWRADDYEPIHCIFRSAFDAATIMPTIDKTP